ncbi:serine/threonine-protein kinase RIO1-like [Octopus vulgaris]|uniref:Serine/threonine-protein kinase RIO1-like n=2 Tax=Octopus TaxID=6643 RepID=A0AA36B4Z6_OCTVU|nr:serine/threonine-protein kinase RIO1 [Octopus sinensis]CAI9728028.1 serine/threonine-protein kinase RIO1-like [Octopus vulgaris]
MDGQFDDAVDDTSEPILQEKFEKEVYSSSSSEENEESSDDYDDDLSFEWTNMSGNFTKRYNTAMSGGPTNSHQTASQSKNTKESYQPLDKVLKNVLDLKMKTTKYEGPSNCFFSKSERKAEAERLRGKDKSERATSEQALDPRTRMIIFKLLGRGVIYNINGCISTGKEANVYHATGKDDFDIAVKIYKTSILVFKDRDKYVSGEYRFRHGYCKRNPRKMVKTWAEKEMRNLQRIHQSGILCPKPILLRSHVFLMEFIGKDGWPAPLLHEAVLTESKARELYLDCILMMRTLYHECRLVHADLSEFNMLFHEGKIYLIDVSQSVEHDHPNALFFLRKDCTNVTDFFRKHSVCGLTVKELFDFVTDSSITDTNVDDYLDKAMTITAGRTLEEITQQDKVDEEVFKKIFIPRNLDEVVNFERDILNAKKGDTEQVYYQTVVGQKPDLSGPQKEPLLLEKQNDETGSAEESAENSDQTDDSGQDSDDENEDSGKNVEGNIHHRARNESPNSRKNRKKLVKEAKQKSRSQKIPKHVKKRKEKLAKTKR